MKKILFAILFLFAVPLTFVSAEIRTDGNSYEYEYLGDNKWGIPTLDDDNCTFGGSNCIREIWLDGIYQENTIYTSASEETSPATDGDYVYDFYKTSTTTENYIGYTTFTVTGGEPTPTSDTTTTRIVTLLPEHGTTTTSNLVNFSLTVYIDPEDTDGFLQVKIKLKNIDENEFWIWDRINPFGDGTITLMNENATTSGYSTYTYEKYLDNGNYVIQAELNRSGFWGYIGTPINVDYEEHTYIVKEGTFFGGINQWFRNELFDFNNGTTTSATTTATTWKTNCGILDFNLWDCLKYLVWPIDKGLLQTALEPSLETLTGHFPLGYISDFYQIITDDATSTIPAIDITLPTALGLGSGHHIELDITNSLDYILNATTTIFAGQNPTTDSDDTFYEVTSEYWNIIVYLGVIIYILYRIFGQAFTNGLILEQAQGKINYYKKK